MPWLTKKELQIRREKRKLSTEVTTYRGTKQQRDMLAPWVQALYDVYKDRNRTIRDMHRFIPQNILIEPHIVHAWMTEVEDGTCHIDRKKRDWCAAVVEYDEQASLREAATEAAETVKFAARHLREKGALPDGFTPVLIKYFADGAGFLAGKRFETAGSRKNVAAIGNKVQINFGERPEPRKLKPRATNVVDSPEVKVLPPDGDGH